MKAIKKQITLDKIRIYLGLFSTAIFMILFCGCSSHKKVEPIVVDKQNTVSLTVTPSEGAAPTEIAEDAVSSEVVSILNEDGNTMDTRILAPAGYLRIPSVTGELTGYLRSLALKKAGSDILLYDGLPKSYQDGHVAIYDLDIGDRDLQQCADSIIRIYAEYYWSIDDYDKIAFHLTNGFLIEYTKWREGYRIVVDGNDVSWEKSATYDDSYETFRKYLTSVFAYAGTLSLSQECEPVSIEDMLPGDMFLAGGSPGHCVLIVDAAIDKSGNKCYLLAQGYMPAQDFHILKNPLHPDDPWYYTSEITYPFETPQWTFDEGSLVRWGDFKLNSAGTALEFANASTSDDLLADIPVLSENVITASEDSSSVNLLAVGDNLIHIQVINSGEQADGTYNFDHLYSNITDRISAADIAVINQETILGGDIFPYSGYPCFNSPMEIGDAVINAGFDVVLQATNHAMDMGYRGIENDLNYWKQHPQITVLGLNETEEDSELINIIEKNGIKIAMLNYTYSLNGYSLPEDKPYLVAMLDKEKMAEDIKLAKSQADFTIVYPHWGTEYVYEAVSLQEDLTEFYYEQGVDLVIGSHPHVLEPVEWIEDTPGKRMLVYYSLGNFMSFQKEAPRMLGGIANVTITKDADGTYISDASITPIVTHYEIGPVDYNYAIYELSDYNEELAGNHGVSGIAKQGDITYQETYDLAKQILGSWFEQ